MSSLPAGLLLFAKRLGLLTSDHPAPPSVRELREEADNIPVIVIDELLVRGHLPAATRS
jgi:hypothetical protein